MKEKLMNISTQPVLSSAGYPDGVLIGKASKLFLVTWVQYKSSCYIIQCLIWDFAFNIDWICISTYSLNYDDHFMTCYHKFIRSFQLYIFIHSYECNFLILVHQYSDKKFEDVKSPAFSSWWKSKGVWSSRTYNHKSRVKSTDAFNIEKHRIRLKHELRGKNWYINDWTSDNLSCLGQETNRAGLLQVREMFWETLHESFSCNFFCLEIETGLNCRWISWDRFWFDRAHTVGTTISCLFEVWLWQFKFENSLNFDLQ